MAIESGPTQGPIRIDLPEVPWLYVRRNSALGLQPSDATKYFGSIPLIQTPRFQASEAVIEESTR